MLRILAERERVWAHPLLPGSGALETLKVEDPKTPASRAGPTACAASRHTGC